MKLLQIIDPYMRPASVVIGQDNMPGMIVLSVGEKGEKEGEVKTASAVIDPEDARMIAEILGQEADAAEKIARQQAHA